MRYAALLLATSAVVACRVDSQTDPAPETPAKVDLSGWTPELIALPPGFAPDMPAGRESLLFAPGWRDPQADDFWSYVFLMEVQVPKLDAEQIEGLFELYFDGLIGAVAEGKPFQVPADPADVTFRQESGGKFTGLVNTTNAFGGGEPLTLHITATVKARSETSTTLHVLASPRTPGADPVWSAMQQAVESLRFDEQ